MHDHTRTLAAAGVFYLCLIATTLPAGSVSAQTAAGGVDAAGAAAGGGLEEVVVTARRRQEPALDGGLSRSR